MMASWYGCHAQCNCILIYLQMHLFSRSLALHMLNQLLQSNLYAWRHAKGCTKLEPSMTIFNQIQTNCEENNQQIQRMMLRLIMQVCCKFILNPFAYLHANIHFKCNLILMRFIECIL